MPGARPLPLLHLRDDLPARSADGLELVERGVHAVAREAPFANERRRLVEKRALDEVANIGEIVELGEQAAHQRRLALVEQQPDARHRLQRLPQRHEFARARRAERDAADQPLEVVNALERVAKLAALGRAERQLFDRIEPIANALERAQGTQQPCPQQPPAHRRDRPIDLMQQRAVRPPSLPVTTSRCFRVMGSMMRLSLLVRYAIARTCARSAFCVSRR